MSQPVSLRAAERKAFQATTNDGLWDVMLGVFFWMFAFAPYLSRPLGDFWAAFVFLPIYAVAYAIIALVRRRFVAPRVGKVKFGPQRTGRLMRFSLVMVVVNVLALLLGIAAVLTVGQVSGNVMAILLGLILLCGFSMAGYLLDYPRLYAYGLLLVAGPPVGEWLFQRGLASHHGYPMVFGTISGLMILTGLVVFFRLLRSSPLPPEDLFDEAAGGAG